MYKLPVVSGFLLVSLCSTAVWAEPVQSSLTDSWYDVVSFTGTWDEAREHAKTLSWMGMQGHLASPRIKGEAQLIAALPALTSCEADVVCRAQNSQGFWLGASQRVDATGPGQLWIWDSTYHFMDYFTAWNTSEPNDFDGVNENRLALGLANTVNPPSRVMPSCIEPPVLTGYSWRNI